MEWDYRVLDPKAFPVEHERYTEMLAEGTEDSIDPLFVAVLCMVSISLSSALRRSLTPFS